MTEYIVQYVTSYDCRLLRLGSSGRTYVELAKFGSELSARNVADILNEHGERE